MLVMLFKLKRN